MALLMLAGCKGSPPTANDQTTQAPTNLDNPALATLPATGEANALATDAPPGDSGGFQPLGSQAVKDAIHLALNSGTNQRWQDGAFSGYAVPSQTTDPRGCRTVRYTIDQQPERSFPVITACNAN